MEDLLRDLTRQPAQLTLPGGLRVRLLHLPHASHAAALVHVHAGAHDAPAAYPGLAHFLEHLLFLGSERYAVTDSLMAYVQRSGGQLNASTRERHTDFFFQLSADLLEPGLQRLLDMLAAPLLDPAAQLREREVLQAEYLARAQDSETLCDAALGTALSGAHPFAGFHAGNRYTLPVEQPEFQAVLRGYHRGFYHAGQMELLLAGPQSFDELQRLAMLAGASLRSAPTVERSIPPLRSQPGSWLSLQLDHGEPRLDLTFYLDGLPPAASAALDYLGCFITAQAQQSLALRLRVAGWCQSLKMRVPYWHAGQGVVVIEAMLTEAGVQQRTEIVEAIRSWLRFFRHESCWQHARAEYQRIRQRSLLGLEPLARLRYWVEPEAWAEGQDEAAVQAAFGQLMDQLVASSPVVLLAARQPCPEIETTGFPLRLAQEAPPHPSTLDWNWQLPAANPWLQPASHRAAPVAAEPALHWLGALDQGAQGVLYVRWQFADRPPAALWHSLADALQARQWAARQAGVEMRFEDLGSSWSLGLSGFAEVLPAICMDLCELLAAPPPACFDVGIRLAQAQDQLAGDELLIRQLIRRMPSLLDKSTTVAQVDKVDQSTLAACWRTARWDGLACGLLANQAGSISAALNTLAAPLVAGADRQITAAASPGLHWCDAGMRATETGLLLFCPLPAPDAATEAAWRLLARLMEGDFFRRLRSELQLGYAVFSRFSQFGARAGILFAVQSPNASAAEIVEHIETFLSDFAGRLDGLTEQQLQTEAVALAAQLDMRQGDSRGRAEGAWQALLARLSLQHPAVVIGALHAIDSASVRCQLQALREAKGGWHVVANAQPQGDRWP